MRILVLTFLISCYNLSEHEIQIKNSTNIIFDSVTIKVCSKEVGLIKSIKPNTINNGILYDVTSCKDVYYELNFFVDDSIKARTVWFDNDLGYVPEHIKFEIDSLFEIKQKLAF